MNSLFSVHCFCKAVSQYICVLYRQTVSVYRFMQYKCLCGFSQVFHSLSVPGPYTPLECTGEYRTAVWHSAGIRVHGGTNLNCTFQLRAILPHPYAVYQELKFYVQSALDWLCKWAKFQVWVPPDQLKREDRCCVCLSFDSSLSEGLEAERWGVSCTWTMGMALAVHITQIQDSRLP